MFPEQREGYVPDYFVEPKTTETMTQDELAKEEEMNNALETQTLSDMNNIINFSMSMLEYAQVQQEYQNSVINKIPWSAVIGALIGTSIIRENTETTFGNILFAGGLGLFGWKTYNYSSIGLAPIIDKTLEFNPKIIGESSRIDNFVKKVAQNANPLAVSLALGSSIIGMQVLRDPTSSLAFGISAVPAGIIMVDRSTKAFNFINDKVDKIEKFGEGFIKGVADDIEKIPEEIKDKFL